MQSVKYKIQVRTASPGHQTFLSQRTLTFAADGIFPGNWDNCDFLVKEDNAHVKSKPVWLAHGHKESKAN